MRKLWRRFRAWKAEYLDFSSEYRDAFPNAYPRRGFEGCLCVATDSGFGWVDIRGCPIHDLGYEART